MDDCRMNCANCAHHHEEAGQCRRFPPVVIVADDVYSVYPEVEPDEWCGEFSAKDN